MKDVPANSIVMGNPCVIREKQPSGVWKYRYIRNIRLSHDSRISTCHTELQLGSIWKPGIWPTARDFSPDEAIFPQEYFVYYKGKWCTAGGKDPLFGHVDGFQIDPKIFKKDFNCPKGMKFIWDLFCDFFPYKSQNRQRHQAMPSWLKSKILIRK